MGKDNELREWALNHWKIYRRKYTGEVLDFESSSSENWRNLKLEKPISLIPKSSIISKILIFEIPKIKSVQKLVRNTLSMFILRLGDVQRS